MWCLNIGGCLKFRYYVPKQTALYQTTPNQDHFEPDHGEPNQELHHQIVKYRQKREQSWLKITILFFFLLCPLSEFF